MSARERFLMLVLDRLTESAPAISDESTQELLREMAHVLDTAGAYVIMLAHDKAGSVGVELRTAWYEHPVEPLSFDDSRLSDLDRIHRRGPLVINDARELPPSQAQLAVELESRGLRAAVMHGVYVRDELRGFVGVNDDKARQWASDELELAKQLARSVVYALDKQLSERALVQAEERIRSFITETPVPVYCWEFDPPISCAMPVREQLEALDRGVLVECNQAFAHDFGLGDVADAIGSTYAEVAAINPQGFAEQMTHFIVNGYQSVGHRSEVQAGDRTFSFVSNATGFVEEAHLFRIWGNVRNVTALHEAEREVAAQRARMSSLRRGSGVRSVAPTSALPPSTVQSRRGMM